MKHNPLATGFQRQHRATLLVALIGVQVMILACEPPVSDDARLTVSGRVLEPDGTPADEQEVYLYKSDLPLFESDWWLAVTIAGITPYRTVRTDSNGDFAFSLDGSHANTAGQGFAAYFAVATTRGEDRQLGIASRQFRFSNNRLTRDIPTMQFWDAGAAVVGADAVDFSWTPTPSGEARVHLALATGVWLDASETGTYSLPLSALPPGVDEHEFTLFALGEDLRYRTSVHAFSADNPLGPGIDYRDPETYASALDCAGGNVFDLADGIYGGAQGQGSHLFADDTGGEHCVEIDLHGTYTLEQISIHNAAVIGLQDASVEVSIRVGDAPWTVIDTRDGRTTDFDTYYNVIRGIGASASAIRIEVVSQTDAHFFELGEVVVHGVPAGS